MTGRSVLANATCFVIHRPRGMLAVILFALIGFVVVGVPGISELLPGGYQDPHSESAKATAILADKLGQGDMDLTLLVTSSRGVASDSARLTGLRIVNRLRTLPHVADVESPWNTANPLAASMISKDGNTARIVASITGGEVHAPEYAQNIADQLSGTEDDLTIKAGGTAIVYSQITSQAEVDLIVAEAIAIPLTFFVLVLVFGGLMAATLPMLVGVFSIAGTLAILRACSTITEVSIFALNLTTALGFALAIDYTLLILTRYREEVASGHNREKALMRTITTAGRTIIFSAITIGLSLATLALFPMFFLRSFAYAGTSVVVFSAMAALVVTPTLIIILGTRVDDFDLRRIARRAFGRSDPVAKSVERSFWYRWARFVMHRPVVVGSAGIAILLFLGIPFLDVKFGYADDRLLAPSLSSRQVGDALRTDFATSGASNVIIVVPNVSQLSEADLDTYAIALSKVDDVDAVSTPGGAYVDGKLSGPPVGAAAVKNGSAFLTIANSTQTHTPSSERLLDQLHSVPPPRGAHVLFTGLPQINRDSVKAVQNKLPMAFSLIAASTFLLLLLLTGSVLLPLKALFLNVLSLSATFGAVVWIFQQGHLAGLGTDATGTLIYNIPILLFCIAFGLSMDYEVFVVARIREYWLTSAQSGTANNASVALGLARTGRVVTAAALIMSIVFGALISSKTASMSMLGFGLAAAVLVDATLVRATLVPAFMSIAGRWNWWAPARFAQVVGHPKLMNFRGRAK